MRRQVSSVWPDWLLQAGREALRAAGIQSRPIPDALWAATLQQYSFLDALDTDELAHLKKLSAAFLQHKQFTGAQGLEVTDEMAVAIAAQACLPVLHLGLRWYRHFKGIVVHPGAMVAQREATDPAGVVHRYSEVLLGEAMVRGPVTLSWQDVQAAGQSAGAGHNVVIHEFVHQLDMKDGVADGCPPLHSAALRQQWRMTMLPAFENFREKVALAERFGQPQPWLDAYGATAPAEFFAVACEAYFVNRSQFTEDFPVLTALFDDFFKRGGPLVN
ncbi:MAG: M90 family metallopeptidase [Pseudomonadota bacterium]